MDRHTVFIGIDGLDYKIIDYLYSRGELKGFRILIEEGVSGFVKTYVPALSPAIWTSYATGLNMFKHRVFDFVERDSITMKEVIHSSKVLKWRSFWDYCSPHGISSIVVNYPLTYPPYPIRGVMVSGFPSPVQEIVTYPDHLASKLQRIFPSYRVEYIPSGGIGSVIGKAIESIVQRYGLWSYLVERIEWGVSAIVFTELDRVQHRVYGVRKYRSELTKLYKCLDRVVYSILKYVDKYDADLVVVSDHGFEELDYIVSIPCLLGLRTDFISDMLYKLMRSKSMQKLFYKLPRILREVMYSYIGSRSTRKIEDVVMLNNFMLKTCKPQAYKRFLERVGLYGERVFDKVFLFKEYMDFIRKLHELDSIKGCIDDNILVLIPRQGIELSREPSYKCIYRSSSKTGTHYSRKVFHGAFYAYGPNTKKSKERVYVSVLDIAPTILGLQGIMKPSVMDGRVREDIFHIVLERKPIDPRLWYRVRLLKR